MKASNFPINVRKALWDSFNNQTSPMTSAESKLWEELQNEFGELVCEEGFSVPTLIRKGNKVKMIFIDTFGDGWRNCWVKVRRSDKGEYFTMSYTGNKRTYLD